MIDMLTRDEMASLDRALKRRTHGRIRVGSEPLSVAQAHALWFSTVAFVFEDAPTPLARLLRRLSKDTRQRDDHAMRLLLRGGAVLAATASLSACTTLGGNIKGNFTCRAPDGICAPTSTIDDAALALIAGEPAGATPAGPYSPSIETSPRTTLASAQPLRTGEKVLRIVFPAHIDGAGRFRETTAVHAVVERGAWMTAGATAVAPTRTSSIDSSDGFANAMALGDVAPRSLGELASAAPEVRFPDAIAGIDAQVAAADAVVPATGPAVAKPARAPKRSGRVRTASVSSHAKPVVAIATPATVLLATRATPPIPVINYSLPANGTPPAASPLTVDPIAAIRAQVAGQLSRAKPLAVAPPLVGAGPSSLAGLARQATRPANGPSLFPVSEVNR